MKKVTLILWVIIFGFIALFIFQNQTFFLTQNAFNLNLGIRDYPIPELNNAVLVLVFFCSGLITTKLDLNANPKNAAETTAGSTGEKTAKINADATTSHPVDDDDTGNFEIEEKY